MSIYDKGFISRKALEYGFNRDTFEKVLRLMDVLHFINHDKYLDQRLALKGGTAINLLVFDLPRLSVDIDLDYLMNADVEQMKAEREEISRRVMKFMSQEGYSRIKNDRVSFILDSYYFTYTNSGGNLDHIKFDINYVMRAHLYPAVKKRVVTDFFEVEGGISVLNSIEIFGSKINALNNRAAVRDLYDVWMLIKSGLLNNMKDQLRKSVVFYHVLTSDEVSGNFDLVAANKLKQNSILRELVPVLRKGEIFIFEDALKLVKTFIVDLMNMTDGELAFLNHFKNGEYFPEMLFDDAEIIDRINTHPMAKWKANKLKKL